MAKAKEKKKLKDREAKAILRKWPAVSTELWHCPRANGAWIRAQPSPKSGPRSPKLRAPGTALYATQPDGLWVFFADESLFVDVVAIEVCGTQQNLNDKRSRYAATLHATVLDVGRKWLSAKHDTGYKPRWEAAGAFSGEPQLNLHIPVRFVRVLYALPNDLYDRWAPQHVPAGHEYFCAHSSLGSYNSQSMQSFLQRMSLPSHFYSKPKGGW